MTSPAQLEREQGKLWLTDSELIRRMGWPEKKARQALAVLDRERTSGFPKKQKLWGDRRYWPAIEAYFARQNGMLQEDAARLIPENRVRARPPHLPHRGARAEEP